MIVRKRHSPTQNNTLTTAILQKYNVKYVVIGEFEKKKYPNLNEEKFSQIGTKVLSTPTTNLYLIKP